MNGKKFLAALVCAFMLLSCAPMAALAADIAPEAVVYVRPEVVTVESNQIGMNYVYVDIETANTNNDQPVVVYLTDESGELVTLGYSPVNGNASEVKLGVPDEKGTGTYYVVVALNKAEELFESEVFYIGVGDVTAFFEALNSTDEAVVTEKLASSYEALAVVESTKDEKLSGDDYEALGEDGQAEFSLLVANGVNGKYSEMKTILNAENSENFVKEAYVVAAYNEGELTNKELAALLISFDETIGFDSEDEDLYGEIENTDTWVKVAKTMEDDVENTDELEELLEKAAAVQIVNETHWLDLVNVISDNNEIFEVDEDELDDLLGSKKLRRAFCEEFKGTYYSIAEIQEAWEDAFEKAEDETSGSGSSGGSGGSSAPTVTVNKTSTQITDAENNFDPNVAILDYYTDMAGYQWSSEAVLKLTQAGIISGYGDKTFAPGNSLTRAEFTKMIVNVFGLADITATSSFTDVDKDAWYYIYIASAEKYSLAQGYGNGLFGVNDPISRQDAVTLIHRAIKVKGLSVDRFAKSIDVFKDKNEIAPYAHEAVVALYNAGIYMDATDPTSLDVFEPKKNASRAYVAVILNQVYMQMN